jgi:thiamine pyrophosphate-dependent acetolactate synthase large subunit-like protein
MVATVGDHVLERLADGWGVRRVYGYPGGRHQRDHGRIRSTSRRLPDGAIVTADSGSVANWYARTLKLRAGMMASLSGTLATMGCAVPYAIGAKFAHPDRPVIALVGDGAMQMNGMAELITMAKHRHEWADQRLIVLVLNNRDLNPRAASAPRRAAVATVSSAAG